MVFSTTIAFDKLKETDDLISSKKAPILMAYIPDSEIHEEEFILNEAKSRGFN